MRSISMSDLDVPCPWHSTMIFAGDTRINSGVKNKVRPLALRKKEQSASIAKKRHSLDTILKERVSTLCREAASNKREPSARLIQSLAIQSLP